MPTSSAPPVTQSVREGFHTIVDALCNRYAGLSPFEVMHSDLRDVYDLYVDVAIHDYKEKTKSENKTDGVFVTSKTATWH